MKKTKFKQIIEEEYDKLLNEINPNTLKNLLRLTDKAEDVTGAARVGVGRNVERAEDATDAARVGRNVERATSATSRELAGGSVAQTPTRPPADLPPDVFPTDPTVPATINAPPPISLARARELEQISDFRPEIIPTPAEMRSYAQEEALIQKVFDNPVNDYGIHGRHTELNYGRSRERAVRMSPGERQDIRDMAEAAEARGQMTEDTANFYRVVYRDPVLGEPGYRARPKGYVWPVAPVPNPTQRMEQSMELQMTPPPRREINYTPTYTPTHAARRRGHTTDPADK